MSNKKKTIYFHIGSPKTGSTAVQWFLSINNKKLLKQGLFYPIVGRNHQEPVSGKVMYVNGSLLMDESYKEHFEEMVSAFEKTGANKMIISEEGIFDHLDDFVIKIKSIASSNKYNYKIIVYLRNSLEYCSSLWKENVRQCFETSSLEEYIDGHCYSSSLNGIHELSEIIGVDNIIVKTYEKETWLNNNLLEDFFSIFGINNLEIYEHAQKLINTGYSRHMTEKYRYLNMLGLQMFRDLSGTQKVEEMLGIFYGIFLRQESASSPRSLFESIPDDIIKKICDKNYLDECQIARTFLKKDELFIKRYPKIYGKEREPYIGLSSEEKADLKFIANSFLLNSILGNQERILTNSLEK